MKAILLEQGYENPVQLPTGEWAATFPFLFTTAIITGFNEVCYSRRWCYKIKSEAIEALSEWNGEGHPKGKFTRYMGPEGTLKWGTDGNLYDEHDPILLRQKIEEREKEMQREDCECHACIKEFNLKAGDGDDWFSQLSLNTTKMILCPECGNKRCPKASDHRHFCTGSNEPGQRGSVYK